MRTAFQLVCLGILLPVAGSAAADEDFTRYLHPDSRFLMGIEMSRIANSALANKVRQEMMGSAKLSGFDPFQDVKRILISSPGQRKPVDNPPGGATAAVREPPFLAVIVGRFDLQKLKELATAEGEVIARYGSVELIAPPHGKTSAPHFALVSSTLLLAGDAVSMREAIDRSMLPSAPTMNVALRHRAAALAASTDVWMTSLMSPAELGAGRAPGLNMFSDVRSMDMAMSLERGLGLQLILNTRTRASAGKLAGTIQGLTQLAASPGADAAAELVKSLSIKHEGTAVTMSLDLDPGTIDKVIAQMRQAAEPQVVAGGKPTAAGRKKSVPPERQVIRIYGAEGGPIEIPFDPPSNE